MLLHQSIQNLFSFLKGQHQPLQELCIPLQSVTMSNERGHTEDDLQLLCKVYFAPIRKYTLYLTAHRLAIGNIDMDQASSTRQPLLQQIFQDTRIKFLSFETHADINHIPENRTFFHAQINSALNLLEGPRSMVPTLEVSNLHNAGRTFHLILPFLPSGMVTCNRLAKLFHGYKNRAHCLKCALYTTLFVVLGVSIPRDKMNMHPHRDKIAHMHADPIPRIKEFLQAAYSPQNAMHVLIDCSWMSVNFSEFQSTRITDLLTGLIPSSSAEELFIMLDFGLNSMERSDDANNLTSMVTTLTTEIVQHDVNTLHWFRQNVQILWPNQAVFKNLKEESSLEWVPLKRRSVNDRCFCSETQTVLHFGHTRRGEKYMVIKTCGIFSVVHCLQSQMKKSICFFLCPLHNAKKSVPPQSMHACKSDDWSRRM